MPLEDVDFSDLYTFTRTSDAQYLGSGGTIETAAIDAPAIAWSASGVAQGLVLNGAAIQLLANTSDPGGLMSSTFAVTETADATTAPDGTATAMLLKEDATNGSHYIGHNAGFPTTADDAVTWSFFVKASGRTKIQVSLMDFSALSNFIRSTIDLTAGTATGSAGGTGELTSAHPPEAYPNGWWRVSLTGKPNPGSAGDTYPRIALLTAGGAGNYQGDDTSGVYLWGHNLVESLDRNAFIETTTAPKTRGADLCSLNSLDTTFGATQGTFYAKFLAPGPAPAGANRTIMHADDGTTDNSYDLRMDAGASTVSLVVRAGGVEVANITAGSVVVGSTTTVAFSYVADAFRISLNGATAVSDTAGAVPTGITALYLGASSAAGANPLNGIIKQFRRLRAALNAVDLKTYSAT